jgi:hypothetical protein
MGGARAALLAIRSDLIRSAQRIPGKRNEVGAGVIDALTVVNSTRK